ncbi:unnamed protein product [Acanthoscelides obtectus]|uniref:Uncharacterized protein n=1 Tax=Acanthoscelides obtectus TaxID=200917 RepID=A0A9P0M4C5_ACAOB|nr:unnamed protein product [Acanthoscelides obtectus]CAK1627284.1 hypothetical protein AOBTE_LOCUS4480 [Acanthoscelides obtectus]
MAGKKWSYKDLENMTYEEYRNVFFEDIPSGNESDDDQNGSDEDVHFAAQKRNNTVRDGGAVLAMSNAGFGVQSLVDYTHIITAIVPAAKLDFFRNSCLLHLAF